MEKVIKTIQTSKGAKVSLIQPDKGNAFFRYHAGAKAGKDSFRYVIRQHGMEDTATVNIQVELPQDAGGDPNAFETEFQKFLDCVSNFMDGSPGLDALLNLLGIEEGDVLNDDWLTEVFRNFKFLDYAGRDGTFDYRENIGTYSYIRNEGYWDYKKEGEVMSIRFPSSPEGIKNNTELNITGILTMPMTTDHAKYNIPVILGAELKVNGKVLLSTSVHLYYLDGYTNPIGFRLQRAKIAPYEINANFVPMDRSGYYAEPHHKDFVANGNIRNEGGCSMAWGARVNVNQDLREPWEKENITIHGGDLAINDLTFKNLGSFFEVVRQELNDQEAIDKVMNVDVLLKEKAPSSSLEFDRKDVKVGNLRFNLKEQAFELVYLDGKVQNISDEIASYFKTYFEEPKATGEVRNQAFNISKSSIGKSTFRTTTTSAATFAKTTTDKFSEAARIRTARKGFDAHALWQRILDLFRIPEQIISVPRPDFPGDISIPDYPGPIGPTPFPPKLPGPITGPVTPGLPGPIVLPDQPGTVVNPGTVINPGTIITPSPFDPGTVINPGTTINPGTIRPGTIDPGTIRPGAIEPGTIKPGTIDPGTIRPGAINPPTSGGIIDPGRIPGMISTPTPDLSGLIADPGLATPDKFETDITPELLRPDGFVDMTMRVPGEATKLAFENPGSIKHAGLSAATKIEAPAPKTIAKAPTTTTVKKASTAKATTASKTTAAKASTSTKTTAVKKPSTTVKKAATAPKTTAAKTTTVKKASTPKKATTTPKVTTVKAKDLTPPKPTIKSTTTKKKP